jgi:hypothetical protein
MRVYHERLRVPVSWWLLGLAVVALLGTELAAGLGWAVALGIYAVMGGGWAAVLLSLGRARVEVAGGELRAGRHRLPLAGAGEVTALDEAQARALRGPRGDPAALVLMRPYLRTAVYVHQASGRGSGPPYWLIGTRHPVALAAAIEAARPAEHAGGTHVG